MNIRKTSKGTVQMREITLMILLLISIVGCKDEFKSTDLQTYNLRGHVKSVDINAYNFDEEEDKYCKEHLEFDDAGKRIVNSDYTVKRNAEGYIILIDGGLDGEGFEYDSHQRVKSRRDWSTSTQIECYIKFDADGNPLESELYGEPDPENNGKDKPFGMNKYEYIETDSHGNWTLRSAERIETSYSSYGEDREWMEERVIEYY